MTLSEFKTNRNEIIRLCKVSVKEDGYARVGHAFKGFATCESDDKSYYASISAILIQDERYIRTPLVDKDGNIVDYEILENPNYGLNENIKITNRALRIFAGATLILGIITLIINADSITKKPQQGIIIQNHLQGTGQPEQNTSLKSQDHSTYVASDTGKVLSKPEQHQ